MNDKRSRVCWTRTKRQLMVVAYPAGCRPHDSGALLLPLGLGLIWLARERWRFRAASRGGWVLEIRDPNTERAFATRDFPDEPSAVALLDGVRDRLVALHAIDDESAREALYLT